MMYMRGYRNFKPKMRGFRNEGYYWVFNNPVVVRWCSFNKIKGYLHLTSNYNKFRIAEGVRIAKLCREGK